MRILFLSGRELPYQRNEVILRALERLGTVTVIGPQAQPRSLLWSSFVVTLRSMPHLVFGQFDLIFVGFFGHLLMFPVKLLSSKPVLFDAFISVYDTLSGDRNVFPQGSWRGKLAYWLDQTACRRANHVLLDTRQQVEFFTSAFDLPSSKLSSLPVGCNEDLFYPKPSPSADARTNVLYYSTYQPLHGVETVVRAAEQISYESNISFKLIGRGQEYARVNHLAHELNLSNVTFTAPVPIEQLPGEIAAADICLGGHFGTSEKAGRVVPGKIYQILAMERAVIAADSQANTALLTHGETAYLVPPSDPQSLAEAILTLHKDIRLRQRLAEGGRQLFVDCCGEASITQRLLEILQKVD